MEEAIKHFFGNLWEWLFAAVVGLVGFIYLSDKKTIGERFKSAKERYEKLEARITHVENNHMSRPEINDLVESTKRDYQKEHSNIMNAIGECNKILREDIHEIRMMLESRASNRNKDQ